LPTRGQKNNENKVCIASSNQCCFTPIRKRNLLSIFVKKTPIKVKKDINYLFMKQKINKLYSYLVSVPEHRLDIKNKEDLVEEIIKIYGYNNIPISLPA